MAPMRWFTLQGLTALTLAALCIDSRLGGAQASCAKPGNLTTDGIDCLVFDPATSTTVIAELRDANLAINDGGTSYFQVGFRSQPSGNYPVNDIGFHEKNETAFTLFTTDDILSAVSPAYGYTSIDTGFSTNPIYVQFTIPGGYAVPAGASFQLLLLTNTDGATGTDGQLVPVIGNYYAAIPRDFYSIPITDSPTAAPSFAPTGRPTRAPTGIPTSSPSVAPTGAPTYAVVSPNFCYELCRDYYRNLGLEYFFFQIYNNGTHEVCGCCDDCDTTTPGPPNSEVFHVTEPTFPPSPAPTPAPTPALPNADCPPTRIRAKPSKKQVEQGKKLDVRVTLKLPRQKHQKAENGTMKHKEKHSMGVLVTLPPNATLVSSSGAGKKGLMDFTNFNETTLAWRPHKRSGRRKLTLGLRIRVQRGFPYSMLVVDLAGFTGDFCVGSRTTVTVPVLTPKQPASKGPKSKHTRLLTFK